MLLLALTFATPHAQSFGLLDIVKHYYGMLLFNILASNYFLTQSGQKLTPRLGFGRFESGQLRQPLLQYEETKAARATFEHNYINTYHKPLSHSTQQSPKTKLTHQ